MKKIIICVLCAILGYQRACAQVGEHRNDFAFGVNGGYVLSNVGFSNPSVPQTMHGGITGGVSARYVCEKYFNTICSVYAEVNYSQIGWKEDIRTAADTLVFNPKIGENGDYERYSRTISYIQIPLFAHLAWGKEEKGMNFFLNLGPQFGFKLSDEIDCNYDYKNGGSVPSNSLDETGMHAGRSSSSLSQEYTPLKYSFDYGIAGGVGAEYSVPKVGHFLAEARYYYGLGNIFGNSKSDVFSKSNYGNIVFKVSYLFDITKTKDVKRK